MPNHKLTSRPAVAKIKHPAQGTTFYSDPTLKTDPDARGIRLAVGVNQKVWHITRRIDGGVRTIKLGAWPSLADVYAARDVAKEKMLAVSTHTDAPSTGIRTLRDAMESHIEKSHAAARTHNDYRTQVDRHMSAVFDMPLEDVTLAHLERVLRATQKDRQATATTKHLDQIIRMAFKRAAVLRRIPNVADGLDKVRYSPKTNTVAFAADQWPALDMIRTKRAQNIFIAGAFELMLFTGLRAGNVISLRWEDIDLDARTLHVARLKNGKDRVFPISDRVVALLTSLPRTSTWVFPQQDVSKHIFHPDTLSNDDHKLRPHDCRRLFTTAARRLELPAYVISQLRGDVGRDMQDLYDQGSMKHSHVNAIAKQIEVECGVTPDLRLVG